MQSNRLFSDNLSLSILRNLNNTVVSAPLIDIPSQAYLNLNSFSNYSNYAGREKPFSIAWKLLKQYLLKVCFIYLV